ncbi:uncharacterized protein K452DRAFT_89402 [Aplosporella prunicola CBS 121167]|uniref:Zn(2)-C6 fungal-type domain-containing protein n=1 Tax=Aplosporella prunicola CBS 121167 TaxID=1176127 RepID=A0A6A6B3K1_9PEZI|nr:uncharacterized protein K452DRAFT_89402 [Aplosporella prunicola CBS 121167]KAF2138630.1 hypothetical protein K452DRAFT_89402 [Aplosporella prunicola CBS 121167]
MLQSPSPLSSVSNKHRSACERCRRQKLRCERRSTGQEVCDRCRRANAECTTFPISRMGRPAHVGRQHPECRTRKSSAASSGSEEDQLLTPVTVSDWLAVDSPQLPEMDSFLWLDETLRASATAPFPPQDLEPGLLDLGDPTTTTTTSTASLLPPDDTLFATDNIGQADWTRQLLQLNFHLHHLRSHHSDYHSAQLVTSMVTQSRQFLCLIRKLPRRLTDLPTCLSVLACYMNLVRFCQNVFARVHTSLQVGDFATVSSAVLELHIGSISLGEDMELQIFVLIQVVTYLLGTLGKELGLPAEHSINRTKPGDSRVLAEILTPALVGLIICKEKCDPAGSATPHCSTGTAIEALREEIRTLKSALSNMMHGVSPIL